MRKAAGIMMIVLGMGLLIFLVYILIDYGSDVFGLELFYIIASAFIATGGVFCLVRKMWGVCLGSGLVTVLLGVTSLAGNPSADNMIGWSFAFLGIVPIIFVFIRKREWQEISDSVDGKVSYDG